ncbi:hypothetical protein [Microbacterium lacticum]|uniref:hypothetical protein n=1 Tax=Microbacterium lacticum TaxID=33885 RepID=UPI003A88DE1B
MFVTLVVTMAVVALLTSGLLLLEGQRAGRAEAERVTQAVAQTLAHAPDVRAALTGDGAAAARLQERAEEVMTQARVDFVTVMDAEGIRLTHRNPEEIGRLYIGTIPDRPTVLTEQFTGTLGPGWPRAATSNTSRVRDVWSVRLATAARAGRRPSTAGGERRARPCPTRPLRARQ